MYFQELEEHYTTKAWYMVLRSLLMFGLGVMFFIVPQTLFNWLIPAIGVLIIVDGALIAAPILAGKTTRHLWKVVLLREVLQMMIGLVLIFNHTIGFDLLIVLVSAMLFFRGIIQLVLFVEVHASFWHRRWLLLSTLAFLGLSGWVFIESMDSRSFFVLLVGSYLIFEGIIRAFAVHRLQTTVNEIMTYEQSILAGKDGQTTSADSTAVTKPEPRPERSFLLPHLDTHQYKKIMILTPHPDDLEGFVGGLAYRLTGEIVSIIFAGGDKGLWSEQYKVMDAGDYIRVRLDESAKAARLLGVKEIIYMGYLDRGVVADENAINRTLEQMRAYEPDLVISFEYFKRATPYPHPDHIATAKVVRHAVARYEKADQLDYLVVSTLMPNCFVNVTGVRRIKLEALACHTTQNDLNTLIFPFFEKLLSRLWGVFAGVDYAEGYRQIDIDVLRKKLNHD